MKLRSALIILICVICGCSASALAGGVLKPRKAWEDNRLIGAWHLSGSNWISDKNPRGWLNNQTFDQYLDGALPIALKYNAQGITIWDIEGSNPADKAQYIGSPDLAAQINPAIDYAHFFKRIADKGLKPGGLVRPTEYDPATQTHRVPANGDYYGALRRKIKFAHDAWNWRFIYIDTNFENCGLQVLDAHGFLIDPPILDPLIFAKLKSEFPDTLLMPEHSTPAYHLWTAPYRELRMGFTSTPPSVRALLPSAQSVIFLSAADIKGNLPALRAGRDLYMINLWWEDPQLQDMLQIYQQN